MTMTRIEVFADDPGGLIGPASAAGATDVEPLTDHDAPWGFTNTEASPIHTGIVGTRRRAREANGHRRT
jgi:hypothetical protein